MPKNDAFALQYSDLNDFLFADVGTEASGMTLTVLSVLARVGMDPWREAGRLAKLPRKTAVDGLARIIAGMPTSRWSLVDATSIATRLIALLPARGGPAAVARSAPAADAARFGASLRARLASGGGGSGMPGGVPAARSLVLWVVVFATVGGLLLGMSLNRTRQADETHAPAVQVTHGVPTTE